MKLRRDLYSIMTCSLATVSCGLFAVAVSLPLPRPAYAQPTSDDDIVEDQRPGSQDEGLAKDSGTEINVKNAEISAVVKIFSRKTKRNYILDDRVKGKVSIFLPGKVSAEESLSILESVLAYKGFTTVPIGENLWKIVPAREARQSTIPTVVKGESESPTAAMVTRLLALKYVSADEMKQLLTPLVSAEGLLNAYTGTNSLIIIDSEDNIRRLEKIISNLDVPFSDRDMTIVPIVHAEALEIADKLNEILGSSDNKKDANGGSARMADNIVPASTNAKTPPLVSAQPASGIAPSAGAGGQTVSGRAREPKIIPDERTNSIILVADPETTLQIRALISQLDSKVDLSGYRFYVYRCQHANAEDLAEVLSGLVGGGTGGTQRTASGGDTSTGGSGTNGRNRNSKSSRSQSRMNQQQRSPGRARSESRTNRSPAAAQLGDELSITADPSTNSLIINASKADFEKIKSLLEKLDIKRRQVLVDAMILEVAVEEDQSLGTAFLTSTGGADGGVLAKSDFSGNLATLLSDPTKLSNFSVAAASSGTLSLGNDITIPTQTVLLSALKSNNNVNVLSSPNLLTTDNEEAEIVVGENVPFIASTSTAADNLNNTFNQVDRQDVGITLRLTPQISSGDFVTLKIFTEVSSVIPSPQQNELGPTTRQRTSETTVITKDGQMIVIGGLMADDITQGESGVPFLKDIPVLGHLFRTSIETKRKRNLLIFITPHIVKDQFDARDLTLTKRDSLQREIELDGVQPTREEILKNIDMNRVSESGGTPEGREPSTMFAPSLSKGEAASVTAPDVVVPSPTSGSSASSAPWGSAAAKDRAHSAPLEFKVAPKLPSLEHAAAVDSDHFILFKANGTVPVNAPFAQQVEKALLGVVVPAGSNGASMEFFRSGKNYRYVTPDSELSLAVVAVAPSLEELLRAHSEVPQSWYTLSPFEVMSLGRGPWRKK